VVNNLCPCPTYPAKIEKAFDYRGDVTLGLKDGTNLVGDLFNREPKGAARQ
jgi:hypothetical protein